MPRKNNKEFTSMGIRKIDVKRLEKYKIHQNQALWEVLKKILDEKENATTTNPN